MALKTIKEPDINLEEFVDELKEVREGLRKLLILIPEESLEEYENVAQIKGAYSRATKIFSPQ